ncbi:CvpA family protein [Candidatus Albibeggiatoa sp. nov. NOAA]|uniref:CvpA family protein n=1 Tax=Candidatus Albibeggiatoa sp. nov. NOAA TaxID=3162724 RepID=UPI0032FFC035|nr:CvpA family protein [Thiotrichaceae bacterium]
MNGADFILLLILAGLAGFSYFYKGLVQEVLSLAAWLIATTITMIFLHPFSLMMTDFIPYLDLRLAISMVGLFILSFIPILWVNYLIIDTLGRQKISSSDRVLVSILGLMRGSVIMMFILFFVALTDILVTYSWCRSSIIIKQFSQIALSIVQFLPVEIASALHFLN